MRLFGPGHFRAATFLGPAAQAISGRVGISGGGWVHPRYRGPGLTGIRLAFEDKLDMALAAIVFAAALDGIDGRIARMIKGQSRFGAELDSLADFVNFGCAPGLILYLWGLHDLGNVGWIAAMVFAICGALRLARFNVMIDDPDKPAWHADFFVGIIVKIAHHFFIVPFPVCFV